MRNLARIREMGNTVLEGTERERGEKSIGQILEQLTEALAVVGARAETEKQAADKARIDAEVGDGKGNGCVMLSSFTGSIGLTTHLIFGRALNAWTACCNMLR